MENLENLEFHYIVSCKNGEWSSIEESPFMPDGTIYDWNDSEWTFPSGLLADKDAEALDLEYYSVLLSALRQLNGEQNA